MKDFFAFPELKPKKIYTFMLKTERLKNKLTSFFGHAKYIPKYVSNKQK